MARMPDLTCEQKLYNERSNHMQVSATLQSSLEFSQELLNKEREDRALERLWILMFPGEGE